MDADDRTTVPVRTALTMEDLRADEDVELWLFRMPLDFNAEALAKNKLKIDEGAGTGAVLQVIDAQTAKGEDAEEDGISARETNGDSYEVLLGDASESGAYQILVQATGDAAGVLRVAPSITRHFVVAQRPPNTPSSAAAAAATESGDDEDEQPAITMPKRPSRMVVPYTYVPQIQGLEVRFKMPGMGSAPPPPQWWKEGGEEEGEKEEEEEEEEEEDEEEEEELKVTEEEKKKKGDDEKKKRRASDGGALKKKGGEDGMDGDLLASPEKKMKKGHKEKKSSKRQSV